MLKKLKLTSFRQHQDREFEFGPGMNAVRGPNEAGKTTCLEAFTYFCFGAGALRESLEHVVTYHQPVSKLRVDVELEHLGVTYTGYRGKSGAEVSAGGKVLVTGQRELTKFFEDLFGTDAKMAGKLMFASQKSLAESLKAGPTDAGRMIEDLANFDLIDRVAESIATRRQTGNTAGVEGRITALQAQLVETPAEDLGPLREKVVDAEHDVTMAQSALADLRAQLDELDVAGATNCTNEHATRSRDIQQLTYEIDEIDRELARPAVLGPSDAELAAAREAVEREKHRARAELLRAELERADTAVQWDKDLASLEAEIMTTQEKLDQASQRADDSAVVLANLERQLSDARRDSAVKTAQLEGRLIKETTCALCQKDLTDVPEVVRTNSDLQRQINELKSQTIRATGELDDKIREREKLRDLARQDAVEYRSYLRDLQAVVTVNAKVEQLYARAADFIEVDRRVVPGQWRWTGPAPAVSGTRGAANQLAHLETLAREALQDAARRGEKTKQRAGLVAAREADVSFRQKLNLEAAGRVLARAAALTDLIKVKEAKLAEMARAWTALKADLATKEALAEQAQRQMAQVRAQLEQAQGELAAMQKYNLLIKKVRAARPVITNKLWNIVLAGVSKHFSEVRGSDSVITRADGMFKCNGFPVSGLSGSAEDMLGLAMRITLTKTFLPGIDMLQLDEPGAACSDARETRMLGMLSTLNFGQIITISHNDLVDAVADRIITV
jgi:DNA repair exonuclease SbcCD ATPase subunit